MKYFSVRNCKFRQRSRQSIRRNLKFKLASKIEHARDRQRSKLNQSRRVFNIFKKFSDKFLNALIKFFFPLNSYNTSLQTARDLPFLFVTHIRNYNSIDERGPRENQVLISCHSGPFALSLDRPFYDSFGSLRDVTLPSPFLSVPLLVRPSNVRLDMHVVCGEGMERDGSASLSVLTGKYLSRHTPPPSTTVDHRQPSLPPSPRSRSSTPSPPPLPFFLLCLLLRRIGRTETALKMRMLDIVDYEIRQRSRPFHTHHVEIYISF